LILDEKGPRWRASWCDFLGWVVIIRPIRTSAWARQVHFCLPLRPMLTRHRRKPAMVVLVVLLLCWECGGLKVWLPPRLANQTDKNWERQQFVEGWLEQRMAKETAERLEQVQQATAEQEPPSAKDAERQAFVKQRLELRMEREKGSRRLGRLARELEAAGIHDKLAQAAGVNDRADADDSSGRRECGEHHAIAAW
jgi:hypothetical protein